MSVAIESYLETPAGFRRPHEVSGILPDERYIEGALEFRVGGSSFITRTEQDLVDQLWEYLIDMASAVAAGRAHAYSFPDQPINIAFRPLGTQVELRLDYPGTHRRLSASRSELIAEIVRAGRMFFVEMLRLVPSREADWKAVLRHLDLLEAAGRR